MIQKAITKELERKKMTQRELCKSSGVSAGYVSAICSGRVTNIGIETLEQIAKALNMKLSTLIARAEKLRG